ncbi:quinate 5-dehydrogenase [bacterium]|nr:quinate 5-dehydrogenase [bacterium]
MSEERLKRVVSVSIGSIARDHSVETELLGMPFLISRRGTDGDVKKAKALIQELDGQVDAIGLGGLDVYLYSKTKRYALRDGLKLLEIAKVTPVVDGSGLKNTLEREIIRMLAEDGTIDFRDHKVLMVCAMDRFGMAQALEDVGAKVTYGDLIFTLNVDQPIKDLDELAERADKLLPDICKMPMSFVYPTGKKQAEITPTPMTDKYYQEAEIIAGDFLFIRRHLPDRLEGKIIITNTVTERDLQELRDRGVSALITTTPEFKGRSFGTNVMEAVMISILGKKWEDVVPEDYLNLIKKLNFRPRIVKLS